jgi:tetratricopeptide (TPR) repeat protein
MALWIAHPIHLSPTMMVIQRMTLFAGTFSLLAMIAYLHGRRLAVERPGTGLAWMTFGFGACLALGVFSKEPAVMTGLYILALEATVLGVGGPPRPTRWGLWAALFVGLPLLAVAANFVLIQTQIQELFLKREFDLGERLLTESRVLMQYLRVILAPSLSQSGPYHDDFSISRGLLDPATTALSIAAILGMVVFAAVRRRANPLLALGILWFFAGHLLESTVLPIELYFEHRNYLPMLGFAFAAACGISQLTGGLAKTAIAGLLAYLALTAGVTYASARVWGDERLIAVIWAPEHPASVRAQNNALRLWARRGDTKRLIEQFELVERSNPNDAGMYLLRFILDRCRDPGAAPLGADFSALQEVIPRARFEHGSVEALQWILKEGKKEGCEISNEELDQILGLYLANPRFYGNTPTRHNLLRIRASVYTRNGDLDSTIKILDDAFAAHPSFEVPLNQAWLLATAGLYDDAAQYLNKSKETPPITVGERLWRDARIAEIEALIGRMRVDGVGTSQRPPAEPKDDRR